MIASKANRFFIAVIAALVFAVAAIGEDEPNVSVGVSVDKSEITIGDVMTLTVEIRYPDSVEVDLPSLGDKLGEFIIRDISLPLPRKENNENVLEAIYTITTYFTGEVTVPPVEIKYSYKDDSGKSIGKRIETDSLTINVKRTAPEDATDIKDIKSPVSVPMDWRPFLLWGGIALAVVVLIVAVLLYINKLKPATDEAAKLPPPGPPHELVLEELDRIEAMGLIDAGEFDLFFDLVSDALRRYLGARYSFNAIEMTTAEVVAALDGRLRRLELKDIVTGLLRESDLVKFAKGDADADQARKLIKETRRVIHETTPGVPVSTLEEE